MAAKLPITPEPLNYFFHRDPILNARSLSDDCLLSLGAEITSTLTYSLLLTTRNNDEDLGMPDFQSPDRRVNRDLIHWSLQNERTKDWFVKWVEEIFNEYQHRFSEPHPNYKKFSAYWQEYKAIRTQVRNDNNSNRFVVPVSSVPPKYWTTHTGESAFLLARGLNSTHTPKDRVSPSKTNRNWYRQALHNKDIRVVRLFTNRTPPAWITNNNTNL